MITDSAFHFRPGRCETECTCPRETEDRNMGNPISDPQLPDHGKHSATTRRHSELAKCDSSLCLLFCQLPPLVSFYSVFVWTSGFTTLRRSSGNLHEVTTAEATALTSLCAAQRPGGCPTTSVTQSTHSCNQDKTARLPWKPEVCVCTTHGPLFFHAHTLSKVRSAAESGRGLSRCLLIEVREGAEKCIHAALHADKQAALDFLLSDGRG